MKWGVVVFLVAMMGLALGFTPMKLTGSYNFKYSFGGGLPNCENCGGATEYACSKSLNTGRTIGQWNGGQITFPDKVPSGMKALRVSMELVGAYDCDQTQGGATVSLSFQSVSYLTQMLQGSTTCLCGTCDGPRSWCGRNVLGLQDYSYGGSNTLIIDLPSSSSSICVNTATITVDYGYPAVYESNEYLVVVTPVMVDSSNNTIGTYCLESGLAGGPYSLNAVFHDPIASGNILIQVNATYYGYSCNYSPDQSQNIPVVFSLGTQQISTINNATSECNDNTGLWNCNPHSVTSPTYQTGWPNYQYGGDNTLSASFYYDEDDMLYICATRMEIGLTTYNPNTKQTEFVTVTSQE